MQWIYVTRRFRTFLDNITITADQFADGTTKQAGVRASLNRAYYGTSSETDNSFLIGSWGKETRVRPSRDVDILFLLPPDVFHRFQGRTGNIQSQLLQEVKAALTVTYPQTSLRGDGQVVVVPFNSTPIEVSPGFRCMDRSIIVCDANGGGRYVTSTAEAEAAEIAASDQIHNNNTRRLSRMLKQWQRHCDIPLKSFLIERLVIEFLKGCNYSQQSFFYYDFFIRDFLYYLISRANTSLVMPGTYDVIPLGNEWLTKAQSAYRRALVACDYERENKNVEAGLVWQDIFGNQIPSDAR